MSYFTFIKHKPYYFYDTEQLKPKSIYKSICLYIGQKNKNKLYKKLL